MKITGFIFRCIYFSLIAFFLTGCSTKSNFSSKDDYDPQMMAYVYTLMGEYDNAANVLKRALVDNPNNKYIHLNRVYCHLKKRDEASAYYVLHEYMNNNDHNNVGYEFYQLRGTILFNHQQFDDALADFDRGIELIMPSLDQSVTADYIKQLGAEIEQYNKRLTDAIDYRIQDNELCFLLRDAQEAQEALVRAQAVYNMNKVCADMSIKLAYIHLFNDDFEQADRYCTLSRQLDPCNTGVYQVRAFFYEKKNNFDLALAQYCTAIKLAPSAPELYSSRGEVYIRMGRYGEACDDFVQAMELDPDKHHYILCKARAAYFLKKYEDVIADISEYLRRVEKNPPSEEPQFVLAYFLRGLSYLQIISYEKAIADYDKILDIEPENMDARYNRGIALNALKRADAIKDFDYIVKHDPSNGNAHCELGIAYLYDAKYDKAEMLFKKALKINPDCYRTHANLGYVYCLLKSSENWALPPLDKATELNSQYLPPYFYRALFHRDNQRYHEAIEQMDMILAIDENSYKAYFYKAFIYEYLRDKDNAVHNYRQTIEHAPLKPVMAVQIAKKRISALEKMSARLQNTENSGVIR